MRCLTLGEELKARGAMVTFITHSLPEHLREQILRSGHTLVDLSSSDSRKNKNDSLNDASQTHAALRDRSCDVLIVDHYGIDFNWEKNLKSTVRNLVVIDDFADRRHDADMLIDPTYGETEGRYRSLVPQRCQIRCGSQYALLRPQFRERRRQLSNLVQSTPPKTVHVFFGGSDPANHTAKICRMLLSELEALRIYAAAGRGYAFEADLKRLATDFPRRFFWEIGVDDMAAHMSACDVALGAPGGATWERACLGLPSLYFAVSQNQVSKLKYLETAGFCLYGGEARSLEKMELLSAIDRFLSDPSRLVQMREVGMKAVDGLGASRVADLFNLLF